MSTQRKTGAMVMWADGEHLLLGEILRAEPLRLTFTKPKENATQVLVLPIDPASLALYRERVAKAIHGTRGTSVPLAKMKPGADYYDDAMRIARAALSALHTALKGASK